MECHQYDGRKSVGHLFDSQTYYIIWISMSIVRNNSKSWHPTNLHEVSLMWKKRISLSE